MVAKQKCVGDADGPQVQWNTPMSMWAGEGTDWIKLLAQGPPRKEDVTFSLLACRRDTRLKKKKTEKGGGSPEGYPSCRGC